MSFATKTRDSGGIPLSSHRLEEIKNRIRLIEIDSLCLYEQPARDKAIQIARSLDSTNVLINPVVVDADKRILIDGHHRVQAFRWLRIPWIPAFTVDYRSTAVSVKNWSRATDASRLSVERAFDIPGDGSSSHGSSGSRWAVVAIDLEHGTLARREFATPWDSAEYLDFLARWLSGAGHSVILDPETAPSHPGRVHIFIDPTVGKKEVIEAIDSRQCFPYEVNRHLVSDRPLDLHIPLSKVSDAAGFRDYINDICHSSTPFSVKPGHNQAGRIYEETTTLFRTASEVF